MSFADVPIDTPPRRTDRRTCEHCGATPAGCRSREWLAGRQCCEACTGDHDDTGGPDAAA